MESVSVFIHMTMTNISDCGNGIEMENSRLKCNEFSFNMSFIHEFSSSVYTDSMFLHTTTQENFQRLLRISNGPVECFSLILLSDPSCAMAARSLLSCEKWE